MIDSQTTDRADRFRVSCESNGRTFSVFRVRLPDNFFRYLELKNESPQRNRGQLRRSSKSFRRPGEEGGVRKEAEAISYQIFTVLSVFPPPRRRRGGRRRGGKNNEGEDWWGGAGVVARFFSPDGGRGVQSVATLGTMKSRLRPGVQKCGRRQRTDGLSVRPPGE